MLKLALFGITSALIGLWCPLLQAPLATGLVAGPVSWWFGGPRAFVFTFIFTVAQLHSTQYAKIVTALGDRVVNGAVTGCVASFPQRTAQGSRFLFRPLSGPYAGRLMHLSAQLDRPIVFPAGCYDFRVRLRAAYGTGNHGVFDRQLWLFRESVVYTGYVRASSLNRYRPDLHGSPLLALRAWVRDRILATLDGSPVQGLMAGLIVGDRTGVTRSQWSLLRRTGTSHLMAISGLHIALVAAGVAGLAGVFRVSYPVIPAVIAAGGYALLAGWSVPTSRAFLMVLLMQLAALRCRRVSPLALLALVVLAALISAPLTVLAPGFWLSYGAVAILLTTPGMNAVVRERRASQLFKKLHVFLRCQLRLAVGLLVPNMLLFDAWPVWSPVVNLVAIPLFSLLLLPSTLLGAVVTLAWPEAGSWLLMPGESLLRASMAKLAAFVPPESRSLIGRPATAVTALLAATSAGFFAAGRFSRSLRIQLLCGVALAVLLLPGVRNWRTEPAPLTVTVFDVGQGSAVAVRTRRHAMLVDVGPSWPGGDAGAQTVLPALRYAGISRLDAILVTHGDNDHRGGLPSVLQYLAAGGAVFSSRPISGVRTRRCRRGVGWEWDGVEFTVLHPADPAGWSENDASCVLSVRYGDTHVLLPGDVERRGEMVLLAREPRLRAALVVVPHHGSKTSSGWPLVQATRPRYAVFTTGFANRWRFPSDEIRRRWLSVGSCTLDTADTGMLVFEQRTGADLQLRTPYRFSLSRPAALRRRPAEVCPAN